MGKIDSVDYTTKTNVRPIVDRTKQSTAEDWNEVKRVLDALTALLHIESGDIDLPDGETSFTITFEDAYDTDTYRVLGGAITVYTIETEGGNSYINEIGIKNITRYTDRVTFETIVPSLNFHCDYLIMTRP